MFRVVHAVVVALAVFAVGCASQTDPMPVSNVDPTEPAPASTAEPGALPPGPAGASAPLTGSPAVVAEVQRELSLLTETHYQHPTNVDEEQGVFDVDCSGFADYVLGHALPNEYNAFNGTTNHPRPLAEDYVSFLAAPPAATGFTAIATVAALVPGDIVSWLEPPGAADTGHVMIVRAAPTLRADGTYLIPIWDSVALPHGATDSRTPTNATGIGEGEVVLFVDANGAPVAHEWADGSTKIIQTTSLGRAN